MLDKIFSLTKNGQEISDRQFNQNLVWYVLPQLNIDLKKLRDDIQKDKNFKKIRGENNVNN